MKITSAVEQPDAVPVYDLVVDHEHHSFVHKSGVVVHNCGFVISSEPIDRFIPMTTVGGVRVTSFTAASVEAMGGLKMDFLTVNSVGDIDRALKLIRQRHAPELTDVRAVPFDGRVLDIYNLPDDIDVYTDIAKGRVETVFQLDGPAARQGLRNFGMTPEGPALTSMEGLSAFTALDRPGPLDAYVEDEDGNKHNMLVEFAKRARKEGAIGSLPILDQLLPETYGVIVYQEQLQSIFQTVGGTTGIEANNFRQRIGKKKLVDVRKKDKPLFMPKAIEMLGEDEAERLWGMMETFGQYGFNKSHSVSYMHTAYACAWLKHHYPLEWWTAVLTNADRKDVDEKFWRYCGPMVLMPDASKSEANFVIEGDKIRAPAWLIHGIGEKAHKLLQDLRPYGTIEQLLVKIEEYRKANSTTVTKTNKDTGEQVQGTRLGHNPLNDSIVRKLIVCGVLDSLFPALRDDGLPVDTVDRLAMFDQTAARVRGKKKVKASASKFNLSSEVSKYQYIKSVMPAYSAPLVDMFRRLQPQKFRDYSSNLVYYVGQDKENYGLLTGDQFDWLEKLEHLPDNAMKIALPAYVLNQRVFKYKDGTKTACDLTLDIEGHRRQFVRWPGRETGLPSEFKQPLQGAFVVALFSRRKPTDSFFFQSIEVVAPPHTDEESPVE